MTHFFHQKKVSLLRGYGASGPYAAGTPNQFKNAVGHSFGAEASAGVMSAPLRSESAPVVAPVKVTLVITEGISTEN